MISVVFAYVGIVSLKGRAFGHILECAVWKNLDDTISEIIY